MTTEILAVFVPGPMEIVVILIISLLVFGLPVLLGVLFVRHIMRSNRERRRLRLEVGKLADEVQQM